MSNYIDYMANFSQSDLRGYLGEDMVDLLVEWMPNGDTLLTKQRMVMAAFVDIEEKDIKKIANLFKDAVPVTEDLLEKMKKQLEGINANKTKEENRWDDSIRSLFNPQIETLFSYELPESFELKKGEYFAFLDEEYDGNKENLKNIFRWSNSYLWLLGTLQKNKGCMYFGELSSCLHNSVVSDPKPYRKRRTCTAMRRTHLMQS